MTPADTPIPPLIERPRNTGSAYELLEVYARLFTLNSFRILTMQRCFVALTLSISTTSCSLKYTPRVHVSLDYFGQHEGIVTFPDARDPLGKVAVAVPCLQAKAPCTLRQERAADGELEDGDLPLVYAVLGADDRYTFHFQRTWLDLSRRDDVVVTVSESDFGKAISCDAWPTCSVVVSNAQ